MPNFEDIIAQIKRTRLERRLSQRVLAEAVGIQQSHLSKIERGSVDIQVSTLIELARFLEMDIRLVPRRALAAIDNIIANAPLTAAEDRPAYRLDEDDDDA